MLVMQGPENRALQTTDGTREGGMWQSPQGMVTLAVMQFWARGWLAQRCRVVPVTLEKWHFANDVDLGKGDAVQNTPAARAW